MRLVTCSLTLAVVFLSGCGAASGDLSGTVSHKGKTLVYGTVTVFGTDNIPRLGGISPEGAYAVTGIPAGPVRLTVSSPEPPKEMDEATKAKLHKRVEAVQGKSVNREEGPSVDRKKWFPIPEKYQAVDKSDLTFELRSGSNTFAIDLK